MVYISCAAHYTSPSRPAYVFMLKTQTGASCLLRVSSSVPSPCSQNKNVGHNYGLMAARPRRSEPSPTSCCPAEALPHLLGLISDLQAGHHNAFHSSLLCSEQLAPVLGGSPPGQSRPDASSWESPFLRTPGSSPLTFSLLPAPQSPRHGWLSVAGLQPVSPRTGAVSLCSQPPAQGLAQSSHMAGAQKYSLSEYRKSQDLKFQLISFTAWHLGVAPWEQANPRRCHNKTDWRLRGSHHFLSASHGWGVCITECRSGAAGVTPTDGWGS